MHTTSQFVTRSNHHTVRRWFWPCDEFTVWQTDQCDNLTVWPTDRGCMVTYWQCKMNKSSQIYGKTYQNNNAQNSTRKCYSNADLPFFRWRQNSTDPISAGVFVHRVDIADWFLELFGTGMICLSTANSCTRAHRRPTCWRHSKEGSCNGLSVIWITANMHTTTMQYIYTHTHTHTHTPV